MPTLANDVGYDELWGKTTDRIIDQALQMELDNEDEGMTMSSLRHALPRDEEYPFGRPSSAQFISTQDTQRSIVSRQRERERKRKRDIRKSELKKKYCIAK